MNEEKWTVSENLCNAIKWIDICKMRVPEGEERERKSKEKNGEKLPKIDEKKNLYIQEIQWTPNGIKSKIYIWIHHSQIIKSKVKEILNAARKRWLIMSKESSIKLSSDFSLEITVTNWQCITCSKYWKKKTFNQKFYI